MRKFAFLLLGLPLLAQDAVRAGRVPEDLVDRAARPLIDRVLAAVSALVARFDDPQSAYLPVPAPQWAPRFSDYRQLERLDEGEGEP